MTPSDGAKANRCCCANESGDARLLAAGRANRDSGGRRQPADTDGLAEVKLLHTSDQPCVGHGDETSVCRQPDTRAIEHASWALPQGSRGPWRETQVNRAGCGGRNNYSQLMKTIKTRGFIKV